MKAENPITIFSVSLGGKRIIKLFRQWQFTIPSKPLITYNFQHPPTLYEGDSFEVKLSVTLWNGHLVLGPPVEGMKLK
jgi:hypothetical protein